MKKDDDSVRWNVEFPFRVQVGGDGYWTRRSRTVIITDIRKYGDLIEVYFDPETWSTAHDGLIYTDRTFLRELQARCSARLDYTEQGMQGEDYVSMEIV